MTLINKNQENQEDLKKGRVLHSKKKKIYHC